MNIQPQSAPASIDSAALPSVAEEGTSARETTYSASRDLRRILFVMDTLNFGGTETQTVQVAERLHAAGFRVTVACLHTGGPLTDHLERVGIRIVRFPTHGTLLSSYGAYQLFRLAWFVRREKFDVVHAHDLWANLMGIPAARLAGAPLVLSSQRDLAHLWWYTPARTQVIRLIHRLSTRVITNSDAVRQHVITQFRIPSQRVSILRNGVDSARFARARMDRKELFPSLPSECHLVVVVANMHSAVKGHHDLIEAARAVCHVIPRTKFVLVGEGQERPKIQEHVLGCGLENNFLFLGYRKDVPELLSCCDLSVLPSTAEGFPNAVLESMAAGLPVVATRVGGTAEMIEDGVEGLLVPPQDPHGLADAILRLLRDPQLARRLARAGQEKARCQYSFNRLVRELQQIYGRLAPESQEESLEKRSSAVEES
jgi:L-malate glycosyltransferase